MPPQQSGPVERTERAQMSIELIREARRQVKAETIRATYSSKSKFALWNPRTGDRLHFD
jgi:hypothetical protein